MYYEEKIINGVLMYRTKPDGDWHQYSIEVMSKIIVDNKAEITQLKEKLAEANKDAERWTTFCNLWNMCVEMRVYQNEDGGYSIELVEFVDNVIMNDLHGNTPDEAIDQAIQANTIE